jgi:hypothetical protein
MVVDKLALVGGLPRSPMWRAYEDRRDSLARYGAQPARACQGLPLSPNLNAFSLRKSLEMRGADRSDQSGNRSDPAAAKRAFDVMMQMKKIDIAAIETARRG